MLLLAEPDLTNMLQAFANSVGPCAAFGQQAAMIGQASPDEPRSCGAQVLPFFEGLGFQLPERKGIADFLQEVTSLKDQEQYWRCVMCTLECLYSMHPRCAILPRWLWPCIMLKTGKLREWNSSKLLVNLQSRSTLTLCCVTAARGTSPGSSLPWSSLPRHLRRPRSGAATGRRWTCPTTRTPR
jgi:hypothetical protein